MIEVNNSMGFRTKININYIASIEEMVVYTKADKSDPQNICSVLVAGARDPVVVMESYDGLMALIEEDQEKA